METRTRFPFASRLLLYRRTEQRPVYMSITGLKCHEPCRTLEVRKALVLEFAQRIKNPFEKDERKCFHSVLCSTPFASSPACRAGRGSRFPMPCSYAFALSSKKRLRSYYVFDEVVSLCCRRHRFKAGESKHLFEGRWFHAAIYTT